MEILYDTSRETRKQNLQAIQDLHAMFCLKERRTEVVCEAAHVFSFHGEGGGRS